MHHYSKCIFDNQPRPSSSEVGNNPNPLRANPTKWLNTHLTIFDYFVGLALKGLSICLKNCHLDEINKKHKSNVVKATRTPP